MPDITWVPGWKEANSILVIGARKGTHWGWTEEKPFRIVVLEIWGPNTRELKERGWTVVRGDVRHCPFKPKSFDIVYWAHGPEHLQCEEIPDVIAYLELVAIQRVILESPYGPYTQGTLYGNPYERHLSTLDISDFLSWGYEVIWKGIWGRGNILAWKTL